MTAVARDDVRRGLLAKVHVAKKQLGLDDDAYRAILLRVAGVESSKSCTIAELEELLREFGRLGWRARSSAAGKRPLADSEAALKLRALWLSAWNLGVVDDPAETALAAFCKRVSGGRKRGVDAIQWLNAADARKCIEGLKSWMEREAKVDWSLGNPRLCVLMAQWAKLQPHLGNDRLACLEAAVFGLTGKARLEYLGDRELDAVIRDFGTQLRATKAKAAP